MGSRVHGFMGSGRWQFLRRLARYVRVVFASREATFSNLGGNWCERDWQTVCAWPSSWREHAGRRSSTSGTSRVNSSCGCIALSRPFHSIETSGTARISAAPRVLGATLGELRSQLLHARGETYISEQEWQEMTRIADRAIGPATNFQAYLRTQFNKPPRSK